MKKTLKRVLSLTLLMVGPLLVTELAVAASVNADKAAGSLPTTGTTIAGPGTWFDTSGGQGRVYDAQGLAHSHRPDVCITVTNNSNNFIDVISPNCGGGSPGDVDPNDTRTYCCQAAPKISLKCRDGGKDCQGHWRVDRVNTLEID